MIKRLYAHNYRCLENFDLQLAKRPSALLIGENGSGKSTVAAVLGVLQSIARGMNRVGILFDSKDFTRSRSDVPIRIEVEADIESRSFNYSLAFELPESFKELRVAEENLHVDGNPIYTRKEAQVILHAGPRNREAQFLVDWHLVALPVIQEQSDADPLAHFKQWLTRMVILAPIPRLMTGESKSETLEPYHDGRNFGDWFTGLLSRYPAAYSEIKDYLEGIMPDIRDFLNEPTGKDSKSMIVRFQENKANLSVYFSDLSDGEKCFFLCAVLLAANNFYGPLFCFWDEPDSHLSLSEVGYVMTALRRSFETGGQFLATSHNPEAIRKFSTENTFVLHRNSHLEPTVVRQLSEVDDVKDPVELMIRGDLEI